MKIVRYSRQRTLERLNRLERAYKDTRFIRLLYDISGERIRLQNILRQDRETAEGLWAAYDAGVETGIRQAWKDAQG